MAKKQFSFQSTLESISEEKEYYALAVPAKITKALGTKGPVPVYARVNNSEPFLISLAPFGGGQHYMRVKAEVRKETKIKEGARVRVQITVRDRKTEVSIPKDLMNALKADGVVEYFESLPLGQRSFLLRLIDKAARPETREKRIRDAVEEAHGKREKMVDKKSKGF